MELRQLNNLQAAIATIVPERTVLGIASLGEDPDVSEMPETSVATNRLEGEATITYRVDLDAAPTTEQTSAIQSLVADYEVIAEPNYDGLVAEFTLPIPENTLYQSIVAKVANADFATQDHWNNFKGLLVDAARRSAASVAFGVQRLDTLLDASSQPLSQADKDGWNALVTKYNLDETALIA